jgi:succinyl-CoA synthetase beta subunit
MDIHEYQAKYLLKRYDIPVPDGKMVQSAERAETAAKSLRVKTFAVKAQIHAGGRGKGGGIVVVKSPEEVGEAVTKLIGSTLITPQTGPDGRLVRKVLVEQGVEIDREFYLGMLVDRSSGMIAMIASSEGGVEIEKVAKKNPEKISKVLIDPSMGLQPFQAKKLHYSLNPPKKLLPKMSKLMSGLYQLFTDLDCLLVEINPLVYTKRKKLVALDAKINFDDNALYRHPEIEDLRDELEDNQTEVQAQRIGMSFVQLDGNIGCLINGAGLAMTTLDIINLKGGKPANFLDIGGRADTDGVIKALEMIMTGKDIKVILVNTFGGITHADMIAEAVLEAIKITGLKIPVVVRLAGTNQDKGRKIINDSALEQVESKETLAEAAERVVELAKENEK